MQASLDTHIIEKRTIVHTSCVKFLLILVNKVHNRPSDESKRCLFMRGRVTLVLSVLDTLPLTLPFVR